MKLHASNAYIWSKCTGQPKLRSLLPKQDQTDAALEGSASHEVGESLIKHGSSLSDSKPDFLKVGEKTSNNVVITDEIFSCAEIYANDFLSIFKSYEYNHKKFIGAVEDSLNLSKMIHPYCTAKVDSWLYCIDLKILNVWDYKFGHVFTDPFENPQGICYIAGIIDRCYLQDDVVVIFKIIQPRTYQAGGPVFEWRTTVGEVKILIANLKIKAEQALSDSAVLTTGTYCRRCSARFSCEPALQLGIDFYEMTSNPIPLDLSPEMIGKQLKIIDRAMEQLKGLQTGYTEQVKQLLKSGKNIPGYALEPAYGRETWKGDINQIIQLGQLLGLDISKPGILTPNQAREAGMDKETVKKLTTVPQNGTKLVSESPEKVAQIFKGEK